MINKIHDYLCGLTAAELSWKLRYSLFEAIENAVFHGPIHSSLSRADLVNIPGFGWGIDSYR